MNSQIQDGDMKVGNCSSTKTSGKVCSSSFEIHVSSQEGIKLCVDLNSNPSDWTQTYRSVLYVCENVLCNKSQSFHQELGRFGKSNKEMKASSAWNIDSNQFTGDCEQGGSSLSFNLVENSLAVFEPSEGVDTSEKCIVFSPRRLCNAAVDMLHQDQGDNVNIPVEYTAFNSIESTLGDLVSAVASEHQTSKLLENSDDTSRRDDCDHGNPIAAFSGFLASSSIDTQLSEIENSHKDASRSLLTHAKCSDLVDPSYNITQQSVFANSSENAHHTSWNCMRRCSEEQGRSNAFNGRESSDSTLLDNIFERAPSESDNEEFRKKRQRQHRDIYDQNGNGKHDVEILKSKRHIVGDPRRSLRLVTQ